MRSIGFIFFILTPAADVFTPPHATRNFNLALCPHATQQTHRHTHERERRQRPASESTHREGGMDEEPGVVLHVGYRPSCCDRCKDKSKW